MSKQNIETAREREKDTALKDQQISGGRLDSSIIREHVRQDAARALASANSEVERVNLVNQSASVNASEVKTENQRPSNVATDTTYQDLLTVFEGAIKKKLKKKGGIRSYSSIPKMIELIQKSLEELGEDVDKMENAHGVNDVLNALQSLVQSSKGDQIALLSHGATGVDDNNYASFDFPEEYKTQLKQELSEILKIEDENERNERLMGVMCSIALSINGKEVLVDKIKEDLKSGDSVRQRKALESLLKISLECNNDEWLLLKNTGLAQVIRGSGVKGATAEFLDKWLSCESEKDSERLLLRKNLELRLKKDFDSGKISNGTLELLVNYSFIAQENDRQGIKRLLLETYPKFGEQILSNESSSSCKYLAKWLDASDDDAKKIVSQKIKDREHLDIRHEIEDAVKTDLESTGKLSRETLNKICEYCITATDNDKNLLGDFLDSHGLGVGSVACAFTYDEKLCELYFLLEYQRKSPNEKQEFKGEFKRKNGIELESYLRENQKSDLLASLDDANKASDFKKSVVDHNIRFLLNEPYFSPSNNDSAYFINSWVNTLKMVLSDYGEIDSLIYLKTNYYEDLLKNAREASIIREFGKYGIDFEEYVVTRNYRGLVREILTKGDDDLFKNIHELNFDWIKGNTDAKVLSQLSKFETLDEFKKYVLNEFLGDNARLHSGKILKLNEEDFSLLQEAGINGYLENVELDDNEYKNFLITYFRTTDPIAREKIIEENLDVWVRKRYGRHADYSLEDSMTYLDESWEKWVLADHEHFPFINTTPEQERKIIGIVYEDIIKPLRLNSSDYMIKFLSDYCGKSDEEQKQYELSFQEEYGIDFRELCNTHGIDLTNSESVKNFVKNCISDILLTDIDGSSVKVNGAKLGRIVQWVSDSSLPDKDDLVSSVLQEVYFTNGVSKFNSSHMILDDSWGEAVESDCFNFNMLIGDRDFFENVVYENIIKAARLSSKDCMLKFVSEYYGKPAEEQEVFAANFLEEYGVNFEEACKAHDIELNNSQSVVYFVKQQSESVASRYAESDLESDGKVFNLIVKAISESELHQKDQILRNMSSVYQQKKLDFSIDSFYGFAAAFQGVDGSVVSLTNAQNAQVDDLIKELCQQLGLSSENIDALKWEDCAQLDDSKQNFEQLYTFHKLKFLQGLKEGVVNKEALDFLFLYNAYARSAFFTGDEFPCDSESAQRCILQADYNTTMLLNFLPDEKRNIYFAEYIKSSKEVYNQKLSYCSSKSGYDYFKKNQDLTLSGYESSYVKFRSIHSKLDLYFGNDFTDSDEIYFAKQGAIKANLDFAALEKLRSAHVEFSPFFKSGCKPYDIAVSIKTYIDERINNGDEKSIESDVNTLMLFLTSLGDLGPNVVNLISEEFRDIPGCNNYSIGVYLGDKLGTSTGLVKQFTDKIGLFATDSGIYERFNKGYRGRFAVSATLRLNEQDRIFAIAYAAATEQQEYCEKKDFDAAFNVLRTLQYSVPPEYFIQEEIEKLEPEKKLRFQEALKQVNDVDSQQHREQSEFIAQVMGDITTKYRMTCLSTTASCFKAMNGQRDFVSLLPQGDDDYSRMYRLEAEALLKSDILLADFYRLVRLAVKDERNVNEVSNSSGEQFISALENFVTVDGKIDSERLQFFNKNWKELFGQTFGDSIALDRLEVFKDYTTSETFSDANGTSSTVQINHSRSSLRNVASYFAVGDNLDKSDFGIRKLVYYAESGNRDEILTSVSDIFGGEITKSQRDGRLMKINAALGIKDGDFIGYLKAKKIYGNSGSPLYDQISGIIETGEISDAIRMRISLFEKWRAEKKNTIAILQQCSDTKKLQEDYEKLYGAKLSIDLEDRLDGLSLFEAQTWLNPPQTKEEKLAYARKRTQLEDEGLWSEFGGRGLHGALAKLEDSNDGNFESNFNLFLNDAAALRESKEAAVQVAKNVATCVVVGGVTVVCLATPGVNAVATFVIVSGTSIATRVGVSKSILGSDYVISTDNFLSSDIGADSIAALIDGAGAGAGKIVGGFVHGTSRLANVMRGGLTYGVDGYVVSFSPVVYNNFSNYDQSENIDILSSANDAAMFNGSIAGTFGAFSGVFQATPKTNFLRAKSGINWVDDSHKISNGVLRKATQGELERIGDIFEGTSRVKPELFSKISKSGEVSLDRLKNFGYKPMGRGAGNQSYILLTSQDGGSILARFTLGKVAMNPSWSFFPNLHENEDEDFLKKTNEEDEFLELIKQTKEKQRVHKSQTEAKMQEEFQEGFKLVDEAKQEVETAKRQKEELRLQRAQAEARMRDEFKEGFELIDDVKQDIAIAKKQEQIRLQRAREEAKMRDEFKEGFELVDDVKQDIAIAKKQEQIRLQRAQAEAKMRDEFKEGFELLDEAKQDIAVAKKQEEIRFQREKSEQVDLGLIAARKLRVSSQDLMNLYNSENQEMSINDFVNTKAKNSGLNSSEAIESFVGELKLLLNKSLSNMNEAYFVPISRLKVMGTKDEVLEVIDEIVLEKLNASSTQEAETCKQIVLDRIENMQEEIKNEIYKNHATTFFTLKSNQHKLYEFVSHIQYEEIEVLRSDLIDALKSYKNDIENGIYIESIINTHSHQELIELQYQEQVRVFKNFYLFISNSINKIFINSEFNSIDEDLRNQLSNNIIKILMNEFSKDELFNNVNVTDVILAKKAILTKFIDRLSISKELKVKNEFDIFYLNGHKQSGNSEILVDHSSTSNEIIEKDNYQIDVKNNNTNISEELQKKNNEIIMKNSYQADVKDNKNNIKEELQRKNEVLHTNVKELYYKDDSLYKIINSIKNELNILSKFVNDKEYKNDIKHNEHQVADVYNAQKIKNDAIKNTFEDYKNTNIKSILSKDGKSYVYTPDKILNMENMFSNINIENNEIMPYIHSVKSLNKKVSFDQKLILRTVRETINLLMLFNKINIQLSYDIQKILIGEKIDINKDDMDNIFKMLYQKRFNILKNIKSKKDYNKLLKIRVYETKRFLMLMFLQLLVSKSDMQGDKKEELRRFMISLSPELKKLIKVNDVLKKLINTLGKDVFNKIMSEKRITELNKLINQEEAKLTL